MLVARVRALARRSAAALPPTLESGDVPLDPGRRVAFRVGRRLDLSPKEFALLECLLASGGRVVSAEELLERVWDEAADPFTTAVKTPLGSGGPSSATRRSSAPSAKAATGSERSDVRLPPGTA